MKEEKAVTFNKREKPKEIANAPNNHQALKFPSFEGAKMVTFDFSPKAMLLESGEALSSVTVNYQTYGELNREGDNAIYIGHALTGSPLVGSPSSEGKEPGWWEALVGPGKAIDTNRYFVICSNILGGCYGTTGPASLREDGNPYGMEFPVVTVRDMVRVQKLLVECLGVKELSAVIGGSLGGMQALEWGVTFPHLVRSVVAIACSGRFSPLGIAFNQVARKAIMSDEAWRGGDYYYRGFPEEGLSLARIIGTITYRSNYSFELRFGRALQETNDPYSLFHNFAVESYLQHQGKKLTQRFDPNSYLYLSKAMDLHDLSRGYSSMRQALGRIKALTFLLGISSDILFYPQEVRGLAVEMRRSGVDARYHEIESPHGHDAFLMEFTKMEEYLRECFKEIEQYHQHG